MFKCVPGPLKSKDEQKRLVIEKLENIDSTNKIIKVLKNNNIDEAIIECKRINLDNFIINKIKRLK